MRLGSAFKPADDFNKTGLALPLTGLRAFRRPHTLYRHISMSWCGPLRETRFCQAKALGFENAYWSSVPLLELERKAARLLPRSYTRKRCDSSITCGRRSSGVSRPLLFGAK